MAKRFSLNSQYKYWYEDEYEVWSMCEDVLGDYVQYSDYLDLETKYKQLEFEVKVLIGSSEY